MQLDLLTVREILQEISMQGGVIDNRDLIRSIAGDDKVAYSYLKILKEINAINCSHASVGFNWHSANRFDLDDVTVEMTFLGQQILESLSNNNLIIELTNGARKVGFSRLRAIPALAIQAMFEKIN